MRLELEIPEAQAQQLQEAASRLGVPVEQLAQAAIADLANQPAADFEAVATLVLEKNRELYRRLSQAGSRAPPHLTEVLALHQGVIRQSAGLLAFGTLGGWSLRSGSHSRPSTARISTRRSSRRPPPSPSRSS